VRGTPSNIYCGVRSTYPKVVILGDSRGTKFEIDRHFAPIYGHREMSYSRGRGTECNNIAQKRPFRSISCEYLQISRCSPRNSRESGSTSTHYPQNGGALGKTAPTSDAGHNWGTNWPLAERPCARGASLGGRACALKLGCHCLKNRDNGS